ncbi:MAG: BatA domain-containing protein [Planctomycetota bacterium]
MSFVSPLLLLGATLVALPIILHLIMRRKPKYFEFPALRLVQKRHDTNQRRLRLRHLLLLLLRAAAIALLAFALARPTVNLGSSLGSQEAPVAAALVFDAAPRMEYRQGNQTRLEAAKKLGGWLMSQFPPESQIAIIDSRFGSAAFQVERGVAQQRLQQLEIVPNSQPLADVLDSALKLLGESELAQRELYIFTDLARGAWPGERAETLQQKLKAVSGLGVYIIDVGVERPTNYALAELRLSSEAISNRSTLTVSTDLTRLAAEEDAPAETRAVELYLLDLAGQPQKRNEESRDLAAGQTQPIHFFIGAMDEGTRQGMVRIIGQDGLAADDVRYFTVEVRPPWRVLLAAPEPAERYSLLLREALAPTGLRRQGQVRFDCDVADLAELRERDLSTYAAVCLLDPSNLPPDVWRKLADYVAQGRGLGIFLGRNLRPLDAFNATDPQVLLPGIVGIQSRRPDGEAYLAPRSYEHPVLAAFRTQAGSVPWQAFPVFRFWEFERLAVGTTVILGLNDDSPIVFERTVGAGRVLTMATPVSDLPDEQAWNLLPIGDAWPFVILVNQMALYLVGSSDEQFNYVCGQPVTLNLEGDDQRRTWVLIAPGGLSVPVAPDAKLGTLAISATDRPGNYRVAASEGRRLGFSVNLASSQTDLTRVASDDLKRIFGPQTFRLARTREDIDRDVSLGRVGRELYPLLIVILGLLLAAEHFVANRFYRE